MYRSKTNKPKFGSRWREHFGFTPSLEHDKSGVIWVHAVSVGEVLASKKLVEMLVSKYPEHQVLVTTTTSTGAEQVSKFELDVIHRYMPIDFSWCVKRFLKSVKPDLLLVIETEVWPNTLHCVSHFGIPSMLINGRLSKKSAANYQRVRSLISPVLNHFERILTVHADDAKRFENLGVSASKVIVTGSIKYDVDLELEIASKGQELRQTLGEERLVLIAASTHQGEDEQVIHAYKLAKKQIDNLLLVLVPRHPERFDGVSEMLVSKGLKVTRRSESDNVEVISDIDVYLGDTMGEMLIMMAASDLVFMGGSLIGKKVGGHNFIEPALLSKYCLTGPSYFNFTDLAQQLIDVDGLKVIQNSKDLGDAIVEGFENASQSKLRGEAAYDIVLKNRGALKKSLEAISLLPLFNQ
ncbi:lipid IV(A) 3-deoxy-D-manno-octulosonic acid transferase [Vibrio mexicanus]|uniref:lipid IV(A) 3-deoxy-D-manno-octulosonic acid transferase n=1 Tax=Vibrio mexicanus TaxID=1004326 RepID=UPI0009FE3EA8|nr:lipid IV(A) 3-deoxy-D-manno-octulosonic acid transferase [Vibrio mexicanus]